MRQIVRRAAINRAPEASWRSAHVDQARASALESRCARALPTHARPATLSVEAFIHVFHAHERVRALKWLIPCLITSAA